MLRRGLHGACRRRLRDGTMRRTNEEQGQVHYSRREEREQRGTLSSDLPFLVYFVARSVYKNESADRTLSGDQGKPGEPGHRNIGRGSCRTARATPRNPTRQYMSPGERAGQTQTCVREGRRGTLSCTSAQSKTAGKAVNTIST